MNHHFYRMTPFLEDAQIVTKYKSSSRNFFYHRQTDHGMRYHPIPQATKFGGFWIRFVAFLIDTTFLLLVRYPIVLIFWSLSDDFSIWGGLKSGATNVGLGILYVSINLAILFSYFIIMDVRYKATLGKMLLGLEVVGVDMQVVNYKQAAIRETIGKTLSLVLFLLGFIWIGFDVYKQGWHDKIAETYVIKSSTDTKGSKANS